MCISAYPKDTDNSEVKPRGGEGSEEEGVKGEKGTSVIHSIIKVN